MRKSGPRLILDYLADLVAEDGALVVVARDGTALTLRDGDGQLYDVMALQVLETAA